jgi:hypothetical protein
MRGEVGGGGKWRPNCGEAAAHVMITLSLILGTSYLFTTLYSIYTYLPLGYSLTQ